MGGLLIATGGALLIGSAGEVANQMVLENKSFDQLDWGVVIASGATNAISAGIGYGLSFAVTAMVGIAPAGNMLIKMAQSLFPKFTPAGSWLAQFIFSFATGFFPSIPGYIKGMLN